MWLPYGAKASLRSENTGLRKENEALRAIVSRQTAEIAELRIQLQQQQQTVVELKSDTQQQKTALENCS